MDTKPNRNAESFEKGNSLRIWSDFGRVQDWFLMKFFLVIGLLDVDLFFFSLDTKRILPWSNWHEKNGLWGAILPLELDPRISGRIQLCFRFLATDVPKFHRLLAARTLFFSFSIFACWTPSHFFLLPWNGRNKLARFKRQAPAYVGLFERGSNESGDWTWIDGSNMSFEVAAQLNLPNFTSGLKRSIWLIGICENPKIKMQAIGFFWLPHVDAIVCRFFFVQQILYIIVIIVI